VRGKSENVGSFILLYCHLLLSVFKGLASCEIESNFEEIGFPKPDRGYPDTGFNGVSPDKVLPNCWALDEVVFEVLGLA